MKFPLLVSIILALMLCSMVIALAFLVSAEAEDAAPEPAVTAAAVIEPPRTVIGLKHEIPAPPAPVEVWEPDPDDVAYISRTIWGEVRGCPEIEQRAQAWCILNRVDDPRFPDTIAEVVIAPLQFQGHLWTNPVEPFAEMAADILTMWHNGEREIPEDMVFCAGDGQHQCFRTDWIPTEETRYWP